LFVILGHSIYSGENNLLYTFIYSNVYILINFYIFKIKMKKK